jgi:hypothetical protein
MKQLYWVLNHANQVLTMNWERMSRFVIGYGYHEEKNGLLSIYSPMGKLVAVAQKVPVEA